MRYEQFNPAFNTKLVLDYICNMTDPAYDNLPYWLIVPNKKPAEAAHCRVDDAELVGSWYEGLDSAKKVLKTTDGDDVLASLRRHLMKSWGEKGLRYHEPYLWTHTLHSSFHEMGYILPALNRIVADNPNDTEAERRSSELVRGMRSLVIERKVKTFWSGDSNETEPVYLFPNDVYLKDGGFDLTRHTGRGEQAIRNAIMLNALVTRYEIANDEVALDLATGLANYVLGASRYFNYKMEFFGHVHSAGWVATGLVHLGRVLKDNRYIEKGRAIYEYIRSLSSTFGWVPEYAQWHDPADEHCETCCIKDMIECAEQLILAGFDEYYDDINRFARNQLVENQIRYTGYITVDNSLPDSNGITYHDLDKRVMGGFTGGSEPNSISLTRFRSIAGCCVGMAPVALNIVWNRAVTEENGKYIVNIPFDKQSDCFDMKSYIPNEGKIILKIKSAKQAGFRIYDWLTEEYSLLVNGEKSDKVINDGKFIYAKDLNCGDELTLIFPIETVKVKENVTDTEFTVYWRGCDVVDITPRGEHIRLYQRDEEIPKYYPLPEDVEFKGTSDRGPTQQGIMRSGKKSSK